MKKVININFQGQVIAIEESAYELLKKYIESLKNYFSTEEGGEEIVNDIENRIAELFGKRLKLGINCITGEDVETIISNIGRPEDFDKEYADDNITQEDHNHTKNSTEENTSHNSNQKSEVQSLYLNTNDKIIGGVCGGIAHYFKVDPVWIRLLFVVLFSVLFWVYIVLWIILKPKALESNITKRLYRNTNDRIIGGVCSGIAAYFKIDAWIPRLIFIAPLVLNMMGTIPLAFFPINRVFNGWDFQWNFHGSFVLFYIVLMIIMPRATTVKQKLEMMGEEDYIKSIRETVNDNITHSRHKNDPVADKPVRDDSSAQHLQGASDETKIKTTGEMPPAPPLQTTTKMTTSYQRTGAGCMNVFATFLKIVFFTFAGIIMIAFSGMLISFIVVGFKLAPLKALFISLPGENLMWWLSIGFVFGIPIIAIFVWIARRSMKLKSRPAIGITMSVLWTVGLFLFITLGLKITNKFRVDSSTEKTVSLEPFNGDKLYVDMAYYYNDYYSFMNDIFINDLELDRLPYYTISEDSLLFSTIKLQIVQSQDSLYHLRTIRSSSEHQLRDAQQNNEQFSFASIQNDSLLLLPQFFSVPIQQGFRAQSMIVEIAVPKGKKIEINENLDHYNDFPDNFSLMKKNKKYRQRPLPYKWKYGEEYLMDNFNLTMIE